MTKNELIAKTAETLNCTKASVDEVFRAVEGVVYDTLSAGEDVKLMTGLELRIKEIKACERRNPKTGETFNSPAHKAVIAKLGSAMKNLFKR